MEQYARYRAPAESGQTLISPPYGELGSLIAAGRAWRGAEGFKIGGMPLADFSAAARQEFVARAREYVAVYYPAIADKIRGDANERPIILTGHQPELFHPGVWLKNFVAGRLAKSLDGTALNLVIDGDACRSTAIRVPGGSLANPRVASIEFDSAARKIPWEQRGIVDAGKWQSFAERIAEATSSLLPLRMLDQWWPIAIERAMDTRLVGLSLAQARHLAEIQWGARNIELPQSQMCQTGAFRRFACHVLAELPRFADAYNSSLNDYRRVHRIRNHAHPVLNLEVRSRWVQSPFWVWSNADPQRRPLFARRDSAGLTLSDLHSFERVLPLGEDDWDAAIAELGRWESEGLKLRSRALVTTMFARLAVADLFIHGIGGAKYDEATDGICRRFFGAAPPRFAAVTGTLRLPIAHSGGCESEVRWLKHTLRELDYHPERFVANDGDAPRDSSATALAMAKRRWIATAKSPQNARTRHEAIVAANHALQPFVASRRAELEARLASLSERCRANRVLDSREYAFCLFPRDLLREFLLDFPARAL